MCQYTPRCPVHRHRPSTVCPDSSRSQRTYRPSPGYSAYYPANAAAARSSVRRARYGRAAGAGGGSAGDVLAWWVFLALLWDGTFTPWVVVAAVLAFAIPTGIGAWLTMRCSAWNATTDSRCGNVRWGPFQRCQHHTGQIVTLHDIAGLLSWVLAVLAVAAVLVYA